MVDIKDENREAGAEGDVSAFLLQEVSTLAIRAGAAILDIYKKDFAVYEKKDRSPLTDADQASHALIEAGLKELLFEGKPLPLLSEEGTEIPYGERKHWHLFWMVDPLDGTKEFIKRNGEFTVNIALIRKNRPVLGVVYAPVLDLLYGGAAGVGSYRWGNASEAARGLSPDKGRKLPLNPPQKDPRTLYVVASRSHMTAETQDHIDGYFEKHSARYDKVQLLSQGSSLKICLVAEGRADLYPRFGPTMEWDTAAGDAVCCFAQRSLVSASDHKALQYNRENLVNGAFVVGVSGEELL